MKRTMSRMFVVAVGALCPMTLAAQTFTVSTNPVSDTMRDLVARGSNNLVASAELMPAEHYSYHPTEPQMTFGQLIVHVVQTNIALCSAISGAPAPLSPQELKKMAGTDSKDSLVAAIKKSFDYCTEAMAKTNDSRLAEEVTMFGRRTGLSRAATMITIATDWADHYSTAASYLRLKGILPPTAQPKKQASRATRTSGRRSTGHSSARPMRWDARFGPTTG